MHHKVLTCSVSSGPDPWAKISLGKGAVMEADGLQHLGHQSLPVNMKAGDCPALSLAVGTSQMGNIYSSYTRMWGSGNGKGETRHVKKRYAQNTQTYSKNWGRSSQQPCHGKAEDGRGGKHCQPGGTQGQHI